MNPADLSVLIRDTAATVMAAHDLDASVLPESVTVERPPRNPEHGDYATNLALQVAKKAGANPRELATWLADALSADAAIDSAEVAVPASLISAWPPPRRAPSLLRSARLALRSAPTRNTRARR